MQNSTAYIVQYSLTTDCNPPLFYLIDSLSVWAFGATRFAERLPSVIFGILLIPAAYYLGKEWKGSDTHGLLAALAIATLGPMWYYSQFGRVYMLQCLLFTVFCIIYLDTSEGNVDSLRHPEPAPDGMDNVNSVNNPVGLRSSLHSDTLFSFIHIRSSKTPARTSQMDVSSPSSPVHRYSCYSVQSV